MVRLIIRLLARVTWAAVAGAALTGRAALDKDTLLMMRNVHHDAVTAVSESYYPREKIDATFQQTMTAAGQALASARSSNDACLLIADAFGTLDPAIRIYLFPRMVVMDYGWSWRLVGDTAFVTQLDTDGEARRQGLKRGDQIISINGLPLNRSTHRIINYGLQVIAPQGQLQILAQSPGEQSRELTLAATSRPARKILDFSGSLSTKKLALSPLDAQRFKEFIDLDGHLRKVGDVVVWRASHLNRELGDVRKAVGRLRETGGLILDLRGQYLFRHDTVTELLSELFEKKVEIGRIEKFEKHEALHTGGGGRFRGMVLVLIDSTTAGYAELLARVIQQQQRGVVMGDRSLGQVQEEALVVYHRVVRPSYTTTVAEQVTNPDGSTAIRTRQVVVPASSKADTWVARLSDIVQDPAIPLYGVRLAIGRVVLADGSTLQGTGVAPDYLLLPKAADLAGKRDILLAKALAMLKQPVTPEDAYQLFRNDWDDDEFILDHSTLY